MLLFEDFCTCDSLSAAGDDTLTFPYPKSVCFSADIKVRQHLWSLYRDYRELVFSYPSSWLSCLVQPHFLLAQGLRCLRTQHPAEDSESCWEGQRHASLPSLQDIYILTAYIKTLLFCPFCLLLLCQTVGEIHDARTLYAHKSSTLVQPSWLSCPFALSFWSMIWSIADGDIETLSFWFSPIESVSFA